jgi:predicted metalloenzyme YecM
VPQVRGDQGRPCSLAEFDEKVATKKIDCIERFPYPAQKDVPRSFTCEAKLTLAFCRVKQRW